MVYLLSVLLVASIGFNLHVLLRMRKYRASLKYMRYEFDRFFTDTEERIGKHDGMIRQTRDEIRDWETELAESLTNQARNGEHIPEDLGNNNNGQLIPEVK